MTDTVPKCGFFRMPEKCQNTGRCQHMGSFVNIWGRSQYTSYLREFSFLNQFESESMTFAKILGFF